MESEEGQRRLLLRKSVARVLGVTANAVNYMESQGQIFAAKTLPNGTRLFLGKDVLALLREREGQGLILEEQHETEEDIEPVLFQKFKAGMNPIDAVIEVGVRSELVRKAYIRFVEMQNESRLREEESARTQRLVIEKQKRDHDLARLSEADPDPGTDAWFQKTWSDEVLRGGPSVQGLALELRAATKTPIAECQAAITAWRAAHSECAPQKESAESEKTA